MSAIDDLKRDGFRLDLIYPADDPHTAELSRAGEGVRLTSQPDAPPLSRALPDFAPEFVLTRAGASPGLGRAGMLYRDLIPGRLGGRYIASHIAIPGGGLVADWVHFHRIAFQMIVVRRGWVRLVYEDQGEPFVMRAGDLVLQPPEIRHRVLESSPGLEVVEIGAPALHATFADHELELPNGSNPARRFGLWPRKGEIEVGFDADLVLVDLDEERVVEHNGKGTCIYEGWKLKGWPVMTVARGEVVYENGEVSDRHYGRGRCVTVPS